MTMRDLQYSFSDTSTGAPFSLVLSTGTNLFPNTIDTSPLAAYLTELTSGDTQLSGNANTYRELGGGERLWLVVDITTTCVGSGATLDFQLITSAASGLGSPTVIYDFTALAISKFTAGARFIAPLPRVTTWLQYLGLQVVIATANVTAGACVAWLGWDVDAVDLGGASGFSIK